MGLPRFLHFAEEARHEILAAAFGAAFKQQVEVEPSAASHSIGRLSGC